MFVLKAFKGPFPGGQYSFRQALKLIFKRRFSVHRPMPDWAGGNL
jgi:hypothetical protein